MTIPMKKKKNTREDEKKTKTKKTTNQKKNKNKNLPPWQDMNPYILSKIISHLPIRDQLFGPPFVCRSWLSATLHTIFPNSSLDLQPIDRLTHHRHRLRFTHLLRLSIHRYKTWVSIHLPSKYIFGYFATLEIAENTPNIFSLTQHHNYDGSDISPVFTSLIHWPNLTTFRTGFRPVCGYNHLLTQLADHCKMITEICINGVWLTEEEALCIVQGFPNLQRLNLSKSCLAVNGVYNVLDGRLKCLKEFNILECKFVGDQEDDDLSEDYLRIKEFKNQILKRVSLLNNLWDFKHGLEDACLLSRDKFFKKTRT